MEHSDGGRIRARLRVALVVGLVAAAVVGLWLGLRPVSTTRSGSGAARRPADSGSAPSFELPRLIGGGTMSSDDLEGSPYVLNFWATWCGPCRIEMPAFERVWQKYESRGVVIVGVNINDELGDAREFAQELGISYPLVVDDNDQLATELGVKGLPQTFFVDSAGDIVGSGATLGLVTERELTTTIEGMLEGE